MFRARRTFAFIVLSASFAAVGCNTPEAVSKFCATSVATLATARPVFGDIKASCLRQLNLQKGVGKFATVTKDASCDELGTQADGAVAAAQILSDYFAAINSIAAFGVTKSSSDASTLISQTSAAVGAGSAAQKALASMTKLISNAALSARQQRALAEDLPAVSQNVVAVTDALAKIVRRNYIDIELKPEENLFTNNYKRFANAHATEGEVTLEVDSRWRSDEDALNAKRAAAQCLITGLNTIGKGMTDISANAKSLKAKELPGLLNPYITQLETLIPQIQKAF